MLEHIGDYDGYQIFRNDEGFLEGYKKTGNKIVNGANIGTDNKRVVTNAKTVQQFIDFILGQKLKPVKTKQPDLPKLPFND